MQEILNKLNELVALCTAKHAELIGKLQAAHTLAEQLKQEAEIQKDKAVELEAREKAVKNVEDAVALSKTTEETQKKVSSEMKELDIQRNAFVKYSNDETTKIHDKTLALNAREEGLKVQEQLLKEGQDALEERKKNLREEVLAEIKEGLK